jgi:transposase
VPRAAAVIHLTAEDEQRLKQCLRSGTTEQRMAERARVILLAHQGHSTQEIAATLHTRPARVSKWRQRFAQHGLSGLLDSFRSGRPRQYDDATAGRILAQLDKDPPAGYSTWSGGLLARVLGNVSDDEVWRVLRKHRISLERRRSWCISTDPEFAAKAADIVGLYLNPPENALVLSVDEKPSMQALERAQGWIRLPNGKALTGFSHCYTRHGTTTLFAALNVITGQVTTGHYRRRRRGESFSTEDRWLHRHPKVHFHYTPTYSSWINQVECWFSILSRQALRGASFTSPQQVREAIDQFVAAYNQKAAPFEWKKGVVHPSMPKHNYAELHN